MYRVTYYANSKIHEGEQRLKSLFFDDLREATFFANCKRKSFFTGQPVEEYFYHGNKYLFDHLELCQNDARAPEEQQRFHKRFEQAKKLWEEGHEAISSQ